MPAVRARLPAAAQAFDAGHAARTALLKPNVVRVIGGPAWQVRCAGLAGGRAALPAQLDGRAVMGEASFDSWPKAQPMAFLMDANNAHTVALSVTRRPKLESMKNRCRFLRSAWKPKAIPLPGRQGPAGRHRTWHAACGLPRPARYHRPR